MKKYILILLVAVLPASGFGQSMFDKYEERDDVTSVIISKGMFRLMSKVGANVDDPEAKEFMDIMKNLTGLRVFTTDNASTGKEMNASVDKYLKSSRLSELMRIKDKDANVKFYIREGRDSDHVSELLMFVTELKNVEAEGRKFETVILSLTGDIDLNQISMITEKMNLPDELKEAGKNR